jgi:hypothetical protein
MKKTILFASLLAAALPIKVLAQEAKDENLIQFSQTIKAEDLKKHLSILASDAYEGRETGEKGQKMAADYIKKHFESLKLFAPVLANAENPYFQPFPLARKTWEETYIKKGKKTFELFKDFFITGDYNKEVGEMQFVFAGYGIETEGYSDYKNIDLKGKIAVVMIDEPKDKEGNYLFSKSKTMADFAKNANKTKTAQAKGAAGILFVYPDEASFNSKLVLYKSWLSSPVVDFESPNQDKFATIYASPEVAYSVLGLKEKKYKKLIDEIVATSKSNAGKAAGTATVKCARISKRIMTENVLGFLEGTDKKDEILVITAHYDHIGITDGKINNGADDDGSGTSTVLELAEAFVQAKAAGKAPRRSILFMLVTGEEKGLLGSEYYSNNPIFPLKNTIADLNIDMVGRVDEKHKDNPNYIYVIGSDKLSTDLHNLSEETRKKYAPDVEFDYTYNDENDPNRFYYRSDHYNFAVKNIPIIFYFNGVHEDYHKPTDDIEKINFEKMEKIGRLIFSTAWQLANADKRPKVDK